MMPRVDFDLTRFFKDKYQDTQYDMKTHLFFSTPKRDSSKFFEKFIAEKEASLARLACPPYDKDELIGKLTTHKALLETKEEQLYSMRRSARDNALDSVLGELGLPGGIASAVKGIAIGYDKVTYEKDGSLHKLIDETTDTKAIEKEIEELKEKIERLESEIASAEKKEEESRRERMMRMAR